MTLIVNINNRAPIKEIWELPMRHLREANENVQASSPWAKMRREMLMGFKADLRGTMDGFLGMPYDLAAGHLEVIQEELAHAQAKFFAMYYDGGDSA